MVAIVIGQQSSGISQRWMPSGKNLHPYHPRRPLQPDQAATLMATAVATGRTKAKKPTCPATREESGSARHRRGYPGVTCEEFTLEGYGPGGTAVLLPEITSSNPESYGGGDP